MTSVITGKLGSMNTLKTIAGTLAIVASLGACGGASTPIDEMTFEDLPLGLQYQATEHCEMLMEDLSAWVVDFTTTEGCIADKVAGVISKAKLWGYTNVEAYVSDYEDRNRGK